MGYLCLLTLSLLLLSAAPVAAGQYTFRADLTCAQCSSYSNVIAELTNSGRIPVSSAPVSQNGSIELRAFKEGQYTFVVRTMDGRILHQEPVHIGKYSPTRMVTIRGLEKKPERPVSGVVSVARLQHKVPKKAKKEYDKAEKALKEGKLEDSLKHLQKAVKIDPEYMEAHNNLGSRYMMMGDVQKAYDCFKRALDLDSEAPLVQANMAVVLLTMGDAKGAESAARRAMQLNPIDLKAKYIFGLSLYQQKQFTQEAIHALEQVRDSYPNAHLALAIMHANTGHADLARQSLRVYIQEGKGDQQQKAEEMLLSLNKAALNK